MKKTIMQLTSMTWAAICLMPVPAFAHVGVSDVTGFSHGFGHPIGGADHLLAMVAVGLWAAQMGGRAIWAVPAAFVTMMIVGGALGVSGVHIPFIEAGILVSVLILGVLIAGAFKFPVAVSGIIVGIFAVFHGHAHGSEVQMAATAVFYSMGFALATGLLHMIGMATGIALQKLEIAKLARVAGAAIAFGGICLAVS
jgi:urease accessory protein